MNVGKTAILLRKITEIKVFAHIPKDLDSWFSQSIKVSFYAWIGELYMGYPSIPFTVTLTDDFNLFFEKTVDFYYNI